MARVSIDSLQAGAVLSRDLQNFQGVLLLKAGTVLVEKHLRLFQVWGIAEVEVAMPGEATGGGVGGAAALPRELRQAAQADVEPRFRSTGPVHPFLHALREMAVERRARELLRAPAAAGARH